MHATPQFFHFDQTTHHPLKDRMIHLPEEDPTSAALIANEHERRAPTLNLIAAENTASATVREALCSRFSSKTAEA